MFTNIEQKYYLQFSEFVYNRFMQEELNIFFVIHCSSCVMTLASPFEVPGLARVNPFDNA